jgi:hypothetical protein
MDVQAPMRQDPSMARAAASKRKRRRNARPAVASAPRVVRATPGDIEGFRQAERGEFLPLTGEELERAMLSGELPEHAQRWLDSRKK